MKLIRWLLIFALASPLLAQNVRWDFDVYTVQAQGGNLLPVYAIPGAGILFYSCSGSTCTSLATTYTGVNSLTACPTSPTPMQVVLNGTSTCVASADPYGNMGGWFQPGQYMATITSSGGSYNYLFTVGAGASGLPVNNPTFTGTMTGGVYGQVVTNPVLAVPAQPNTSAAKWSEMLWNGPGDPTLYPGQQVDFQTAQWNQWGHDLGQPPVGPGGWTINDPRLTNYVNRSQGQFHNEFAFRYHFGTGDGEADRYSIWSDWGDVSASADEGTYTVGAYNGGEDNAACTTTIQAGGGGSGATTLKTNAVADCNEPFAGTAPAIGDGHFLLDITDPLASGTVASYTPPSGETPEIYAMTVTGGAVTESTAWGTLNGDCTPTNNLNGPQTQVVTCSLTLLHGTLAPGGLLDFSGQYHEQATVISVNAPVGGNQSFTVALRHGHESTSWVMMGGTQGFIVFTANIGDGLKYPITVLGATSSTTVIVRAFASSGTPGPSCGSYAGPLAHGGSQAFTIYPGGEVTDVQDTTATPPTYAVDGVITVEPNNALWPNGGTAEEEHSAGSRRSALRWQVINHNPGSIAGQWTGWNGINGDLFGAGIYRCGSFGQFPCSVTGTSGAAFAVNNQETPTNYSYWGGYQYAPAFLMTGGVFDSALEMRTAPTEGMFYEGCTVDSSGNENCNDLTFSNDWSLLKGLGGAYNKTIWNPGTLTLNEQGIHVFSNSQSDWQGGIHSPGGSIGSIASGIFSNLLNNSIVGTGSTWSSVGSNAYASVTYNTMDVTDPYEGNAATKLVGSVTAPTLGNYITGTISPPIPINTSVQVCIFLYNPAGVQTTIFFGGGGGGAAIVPAQTSLWPYTCVTINTGSAPVDSIVFASYTAGGALYLYGFNISLTATPSAGFEVTGAIADPTPHFGYSPRFPVISGTPTPTNCANWATAGTLGDAGAPCGSGTVSTGGGYALPAYPSAGDTTLAPSNITTDATGNNLNVPGALALTGSTHGITIPAGTQVSGAAGKVIYGSDGGSTGLAEANENNGGYSRLCTAANGICAAPPTTGLATLSSGTVTVSNAAACTPAATGCTYKLTNCNTNSSAALGILTIGTVSAGTSFVINSESLTNTVVTTDASKVCWAIN